MLEILIIDDHAVFRRGLVDIIEEQSGMKVQGEAKTGSEALGLVRRRSWDLVILDLSLPGRDGLEVLKEIKTENPKIPVLIISFHPEDQYAVRSLKAGASGYLTKESAPEELVKAIQKVTQGGKYISSTLGEHLAYDLQSPSEGPPHEALSDREFQVLCMIASGKSTGAIAKELNLSVKTVSTYRARILEKMHMKNNAEMTYYSIKNHLVE